MINGKVFKDVTISRVEADGIVIRTKTGIYKIYFVELPKDIQDRFHYRPVAPIAARPERTPMKVEVKRVDAQQEDDHSWVGIIPMSALFLRLLMWGALIVTGITLLIVRSRF
jgi:hypothetical protein